MSILNFFFTGIAKNEHSSSMLWLDFRRILVNGAPVCPDSGACLLRSKMPATLTAASVRMLVPPLSYARIHDVWGKLGFPFLLKLPTIWDSPVLLFTLCTAISFLRKTGFLAQGLFLVVDSIMLIKMLAQYLTPCILLEVQSRLCNPSC